MEFQREYLETNERLIEELWPLLEAHYIQIAHYKDIPLIPDFEAYRVAEKNGALRIFTARERGVIYGYSVFFVRKNVHYSTSVQAVQDILYLDPMVRKGSTGYRFIQWCDDQLRADGVQAVYHHVKVDHDFSPVLQRMGYEEIERIFARRLDQ